MKNWQAVLEALVRAEEAVPLSALSYLRLTVSERQEAVIYLRDKNMVCLSGTTITADGTVPLYEATPVGYLAVGMGLHEMGGRRRPKKEHAVEGSLARRTCAIAPNSVFDLARAPWTFSMKTDTEKLREKYAVR